MNPTLQTIKERRSIRRYQDKQIPVQELETIIEAGRYAPSGHNNQKSHIIAIQDKAVIADLIKLAEQEFAKMTASEDTYVAMVNSINLSKKGGYNFTYGAPTIVIVANKTNYQNAMADSTCVMQNLMLAAKSLDIGSCWLNQIHWLTQNTIIREYLYKLGMQEDESVYASLGLGYSDMKELPELQRKGNIVTYIR